MTDLSREVLERELKGSEEALKAHQEGALIHEIVAKAFREELEKLK
jgi:hypothetical protein